MPQRPAPVQLPMARSPVLLSDVARTRALLIAAAKAGRALSYSQALEHLGHRFSRPKMRALCKTMDAVDEAFDRDKAPGLAVLVVRQSDGLPGQGWWVGKTELADYNGPWTGPRAEEFVTAQQKRVFAYWRKKKA
jgi:hypothetical protein